MKVCQCQITRGLVISGAYLRGVMGERSSVWNDTVVQVAPH